MLHQAFPEISINPGKFNSSPIIRVIEIIGLTVPSSASQYLYCRQSGYDEVPLETLNHWDKATVTTVLADFNWY